MAHTQLISRISATPLRGGRRIIALAGAPASGKSTLAHDLATQLPHAAVVPMDGFHRDNEDLTRHGLLHRKGAPETFDAAGFVTFVRGLRTPGPISVPTFDRTRDCVVPDGAHIPDTVHTLLVEGNYLLLDRAPWNTLATDWDLTVMLDVPLAVLEQRLIQRWIDHGFTPEQAQTRAAQNDIPNAQVITCHSSAADITLSKP